MNYPQKFKEVKPFSPSVGKDLSNISCPPLFTPTQLEAKKSPNITTNSKPIEITKKEIKTLGIMSSKSKENLNSFKTSSPPQPRRCRKKPSKWSNEVTIIKIIVLIK